MSQRCPVPGCRQSYSASASLRSHLSQASDGAHKKYHDDRYGALNFDVGASTGTRLTPPSTAIIPSTETVHRRDELIHRAIDAVIAAGAAENEAVSYDNNFDVDLDDADFLDDEDASELETLDFVDDQADRELVVEEVEEDLDKVAEIMEEAMKQFRLSSEEDLVDYLPAPFVPMEVQSTPNPLSRKLEETPDCRFTSWHPTAGEVLSVNVTLQERWKKLFDNQDNAKNYQPFCSRADWELGQWALKEKIKQGSFNKLLNLPGVSFCLDSLETLFICL